MGRGVEPTGPKRRGLGRKWRWGVPHVDYQVVSGKPYWYYRRRGEKRGPALPPPPGTPEFLAAWAAADKAASGMVEAPRGLGRNPSRLGVGRDRSLLRLGCLDQGPGREFARGSPPHPREVSWQARRQDARPYRAQAHAGDHQKQRRQGRTIVHAGGAGQLAAGHARLHRVRGQGRVDCERPAASVKKDKVRKSKGHIAWTEEDLEAYRKRWSLGTRQRLAVEIMINLGVRRSDAIRATPNHIRNGTPLAVRAAEDEPHHGDHA